VARRYRREVAGHNLSLYIASYPNDVNAVLASADLEALKATKDITVRATVVATRNGYGDVEVTEHDAHRAHRDLGLGAAGGLVVGLFSPALLLTTAVGAALGGGLHELVKHHSEKRLGEDLEQYLPRGSAAIMAIVDDEFTDRLDTVLNKADKKVAKAIDSGSYDYLAKALSEAGYDVEGALER
jgi:uncharacterized membrane protein